MTAVLQAGSVWSGQFDFKDGEGERKKFFVLLTECVSDEFFVALTTSRGASRYPTTVSPCGGPNIPFFRIEAGQELFFSAPTWVQFDNAHVVSRANMEKLVADGRVTREGSLTEERFRSILSCAKASNDVPKRYRERIGELLKAKTAALKQQLKPAKVAAPAPRPLTGVPLLHQQFTKRCGACQQQIADLTLSTVVDLTSILAQTVPDPRKLISDVELGMECVARCPSCS